jgi:diaminopimelate epimerase
MRFEKWQALGNDYLILERDELPFALTPARVRRLCDGHFGVSADGVLLLAPAADPAYVANLRIFNPDGSEAELSGNGARQAVLYLRRRGWTDRDRFAICTAAGGIRPTITASDRARVDLGSASLRSADFPGGPPSGLGTVTAGRRSWRFRHVSIGNPQCAIRVASPAELEELDLAAIGPQIETDEQFPNRTNVSWYAELSPRLIRARIFERGVGETLSSGTGAAGATVAHLLDFVGEDQAAGGPRESASVTVVLDGGELEVVVDEDLGVELTGWARPVFEGRISDDFLKELDETE